MSAPPAHRPRTRRLFVLVAIVAALLLLASWFEPVELITRCVDFFHAAGPWPYFTAMAVLPVFGFPIWPFAIGAGHLFGPTLGLGAVIVCALGAEAINMTICYWLGAHVLHRWVERLTHWLGYTLPPLPTGTAWEVTLLVRIVPGVPFFLKNYLLGFARVPFAPYLIVSLLVHAAILVGAVFAGDALARGDAWTLAIGAALCLVALAAIYRLRKRWRVGPRPNEVASASSR